MPADIALIDDHRLFASGLTTVLSEIGQVRSYGDSATAIADLAEKPADLVLLDFYVPGGHAVETIDALRDRCNCTRIVVISASLSPADRAASLNAGAMAFVTKHSEPETLLEICRAALEDRQTLAPAPNADHATQAAESLGLTMRQLDVLVMVGHGYANREIADLLSISPETVKTHLKALFDRLGASSRTEAIALARENGLL